MKSKNMLLVAQDIEKALNAEKVRVGFHMISYLRKTRIADDETMQDKTGHECGTTCCIGGFAAIRAEGLTKVRRASGRKIRDKAQAFLGLTEEQATALFTPDFADLEGGMYSIRAEDAIATLRVSAVAKEIVWVKAL